jgi:hypothetical protein
VIFLFNISLACLSQIIFSFYNLLLAVTKSNRLV